MASAPLQPRISVEEYLKTDYQPDCDYTDGLIEERNPGEFGRSDIHESGDIFPESLPGHGN